MGFRTSFYHYPIEYLESIKDTPRDENDQLYFEFENTKEHELMYDAFTYSVLDVYKNEDYGSKVILNEKESDEYLYIRLNKNQFKNLIKYLLDKIINYNQEHIVRDKEFEKLTDELKSGYNYKGRPNGIHDYKNLNIIDKLIYNQLDTNLVTDMYSADKTYFDEILDNPWKVSAGWDTRGAIYNLIHIYHILDWDKEEIVILGS